MTDTPTREQQMCFHGLDVVVFDGSNYEAIGRALQLNLGDAVVIGRHPKRSFVIVKQVLDDLRNMKVKR